LRFAHILATNRPPRNGSQLTVNAMLEAVASGRPAYVDHGGAQRFDVLYIKDLSQAAYRALCAPAELSGIYNIGSGGTCTLYDLADAARRHIPEAAISIGPGLDFLGMGPLYPVFDIARARTDLDYQPQYDTDRAVEDYLRETLGS
jgi:UDP-glucose 4-epimerase